MQVRRECVCVCELAAKQNGSKPSSASVFSIGLIHSFFISHQALKLQQIFRDSFKLTHDMNRWEREWRRVYCGIRY